VLKRRYLPPSRLFVRKARKACSRVHATECSLARVLFGVSLLLLLSSLFSGGSTKIDGRGGDMDCRGLIGPTRQFGSGSLYHGHLWALLVGAFLPIPFWWWQRRFPDTRLKYINIPVFLNGPMLIPPATGINYSSWFVVGYIFREYRPPVSSPGLDDQRSAQSITFLSVIFGGGPNSTTSSAQRSTRGRWFP
jgi:hypothetical protein